MAEQNVQALQPEKKEKAKKDKQPLLDVLLKGFYKGFEVGTRNIIPTMILGYVLVYILTESGLMTLLGTLLEPVMGLFGLPGEAITVFISAFFAKASGCATAAALYQTGVLTMGQALMVLPSCILMGTLVGHYARIVLVSDTNKKWHGLLLCVPIFDSVISLIIMRVLLSFMGIQ